MNINQNTKKITSDIVRCIIDIIYRESSVILLFWKIKSRVKYTNGGGKRSN
jgi:hypothetical protein